MSTLFSISFSVDQFMITTENSLYSLVPVVIPNHLNVATLTNSLYLLQFVSLYCVAVGCILYSFDSVASAFK